LPAEPFVRVLLIDFNPFMPPVTPISLGNLGAVLRSLGHQVGILSLGSTSRFGLRDLQGHLEEVAPRLVGFGTYQRNIFQVRAVARMVREVVPEASVVIGGPQATFLPDAALERMPEVDHVSRGEGELAIKAIVEAIDGGTEQAPIPGVTSRTREGEIVTGKAPEPLADLDSYPSPWLTGVLDPAEMDESILLTSRGCSHKCCFCHTPAAFGRRIRSQSVERVLEDIAWVSRAGTGRLWFGDPNFSFSKKRVVAILEGIIRKGLKASMWVETRADMLDSDLMGLMRRAGVHSVAMGLESASPKVYPGLDKRLAPEKVARAARAALGSGLDVELFSQYALPGETLDDAMQTLAFVKDCGVAIRGNSNAQQMQLYFGSEVHSNYRSYGIEFETEWMSKAEIKRVKSAWLAESTDGGKRVVS
jgi:radical SAM superfamily enzyme YgiQ (UPF0313 family)